LEKKCLGQVIGDKSQGRNRGLKRDRQRREERGMKAKIKKRRGRASAYRVRPLILGGKFQEGGEA